MGKVVESKFIHVENVGCQSYLDRGYITYQITFCEKFDDDALKYSLKYNRLNIPLRFCLASVHTSTISNFHILVNHNVDYILYHSNSWKTLCDFLYDQNNSYY